MSGPLLLGVDLGTSGVKALLLDPEEGRTLAEATAEYPLSTPHPGWSEQQPEDWWRGTCRVVAAVLEASSLQPARISAVALSGQMHGATLLDASGAVLRPCILWNDQRSASQCDTITERIGLPALLDWVANPALAGFTAPKLLWVKEHEPDIYARLATVLLPKDYINFRLTGIRATDVSDASGTLLFDVARRRWSPDMIEALGLRPGVLPPVLASTERVGAITRQAADMCGLQVSTPVIAGGADNACAAVGAGTVRAGQVMTSVGTSGTVVVPSSAPRVDPAGRLHTFCHAVPDTWYAMGVVLSAGGSLSWLRGILAAGASLPYDQMMAAASQVPPGSEGLIFLPYLTGERTPHGDPDARGVLFGLSSRHGRGHLIRSVLEGVTFALNDSVGIMRDLGLPIDRVRATGGGARSRLWRQIQADVYNVAVQPALSEAGPAFGAAILAGVGVGLLPSVPEAVDRLVHLGDEVEPDPAAVEGYRRSAAVYDSLYPALRERFATLARLT